MTAPRWDLGGARRAIVVAGLAGSLPVVVVAGLISPPLGRRAARRCCRIMARSAGVEVHTAGTERLEPGRPYLLCANHSSPLDIPVLLLAVPDLRFVMAADLLPSPLRALARRCLGMATVDRRRPREGVRDLDRLAAGFGPGPLAIFPEGGIAPTARRTPFKTGPFDLAIQAGVPLVPIAIHDTALRLPPRGALRVRSGPVMVEVLDAIDTGELDRHHRRALRDGVQARIEAALGGGSSAKQPGLHADGPSRA